MHEPHFDPMDLPRYTAAVFGDLFAKAAGGGLIECEMMLYEQICRLLEERCRCLRLAYEAEIARVEAARPAGDD
jgi:hypothetical protein